MDGNSNAFVQSLQQLGQYLSQQNQGTGSGQAANSNLGLGNNAWNANAQQPSKIVTQVHFAGPETSTAQANATPAVSTAPPAPQVSSFAPPQGGAMAIPQPGAVDVPAPHQGGGGGAGAAGGMGGAGGYTGPGSGVPTSNAISGISSALAQGLSDAGKAIGAVKTMPTPVQSGPFPTINQQTPILQIGRRTQPNY